ncbi:hypothetical protein EDC01DRAFT_629356 [Geopyxis carbonaria]|nr:hypothetical protein EDC01DRAFT_629356 [Geopyxis carbonaria]
MLLRLSCHGPPCRELKSAALYAVTGGDDPVSNLTEHLAIYCTGEFSPQWVSWVPGLTFVESWTKRFLLYSFIVASLDEVSTAGRNFLIESCWKFTNWSVWHTDRGATRTPVRKADTKVWDYILRSDDPAIQAVSEATRLSLLEKTPPEYTDGFPTEWRSSERIVLDELNEFRRFARFWYHIIYDNNSGAHLSSHNSELPADHPESEEQAFLQIGSQLKAIQAPKDIPSASRLGKGKQPAQQPVNPSPEPIGLSNQPSVSPRRSRNSRAISAEAPRRQSSQDGSASGRRRRSIQQDSPLVMVHTTFPHKVVATTVDEFDGKPQNLSLLDQSVENLCVEQAYAAYWGGTVLGDVENGYEYVDYGTPGSAANYYLGSRVCAAVCGRFTGDAKLWWAGYRKDGHPRPNCWRKSSDNPDCDDGKPPAVVEISLYDLIDAAFPSNDAAQARSELKRFRWDPSAKDALSLSAFKYQVMELLVRAGYKDWELQCEEIRDRIEPIQLRDRIKSWDEPDDFWKEVKAAAASWRHDHPPSVRRCMHCNGAHDTKLCRKAAGVQTGRSDVARVTATCDFCGIAGHYKKNCFKYKASLRDGQAQDTRLPMASSYNPSGRQPYSKPNYVGRQPYTRPVANRQNSPGNEVSKNIICRTCKGSGHKAQVCPSRTAMVSAPNIDTKEGDGGNSGNNVPSYLMEAWEQHRGGTAGSRSLGKASSVAQKVSEDEGVDEFFSLLFAEKKIEFPLFNNLTKVLEKDDVLTMTGSRSKPVVVKVSDSLDMTKLGPPTKEPPTGPLWTVATTVKNQDLLTIFDTGAVKAAIPRSTVDDTPQPISFIKADGTRYKPAGFCPSFKFMFGSSIVFVGNRRWIVP